MTFVCSEILVENSLFQLEIATVIESLGGVLFTSWLLCAGVALACLRETSISQESVFCIVE